MSNDNLQNMRTQPHSTASTSTTQANAKVPLGFIPLPRMMSKRELLSQKYDQIAKEQNNQTQSRHQPVKQEN
jgi:hypothetical protein